MTTQQNNNQDLPPTHFLAIAPELILSILQEMGYYDLKRVSRVCKTLKTFIDGPDFDTVLFRIKGPADAEPPKKSQIILHPLLKEGEWVCMYIDDYKLKDLKVHENATSPPVSKLYVQTGPGHCIYNKDRSPISVSQLVHVVEKGWKKKLPPEFRTGYAETYIEGLGDHNGWTQWAEVTRHMFDGCIILTPGPMDS